MAIPKNISSDHLLKAIEKIDREGIPSDGDSRYYDVVYKGKKYPPKLMVAYANLFANGEILDRKSFSGGLETQCFKILEQNGFTIEKKHVSFYNELTRFLTQSQTSELGASDYMPEYEGLLMRVSFGKGVQAKIPWIAFLKDSQTVTDGIYPVYLLYKDKNLLILAYGVSETNVPQKAWTLPNLQTISTYFSQNKLGAPDRYGNSFVFRAYNLDKPLNEKQINKDLNDITHLYKNVLLNSQASVLEQEFNYISFMEKCSEANFVIDEKFCLRFIASLLTKPFVILTGLSGSGKTKLALSFSKWISDRDNQVCVVPVGADWTNREPLLGFPNALESGNYVLPESGALQLILEASKEENQGKPYFLILDEMNLSHVERYFADFLSAMESREPISLHPETSSWKDSVPAKVWLPDNLFIIGTVNVDETTYMFSPKVLDRANVIEFRVTEDEMRVYLNNASHVDNASLKCKGAAMAKSFVTKSQDRSNGFASLDELNKTLLEFFKLLQKTGSEFGYRSASEIARLAATMQKLQPTADFNEIIDVAIVQKLLPKVHGSRRKLEPILKSMGSICVSHGVSIDELLNSKKQLNFADKSKVKYPISLSKIQRMYENLVDNGFTSYAEA